MRIRLAVMDMAGTTVRDDGAVERAFVKALEAMGVVGAGGDAPNPLEVVRSTMGQSKIDVFRRLFDDAARADEANRRFEEALDDAISRGELEPLPGAEAALTAVRAAGVRVCLTTGFSRATRDHLVDVLGWRDLVDLVLSPDDGVRGRPAPDLVLSALMRLGVDAVQEVAVAGDTTSDLLAGTRAGASIVAGVLTGAHSRDQLESVPHTHIIGAIDEFPSIVTELSA